MAEKFVPVIPLTQFTGSNQEDLPLDNYINACGPGTGVVSVEDGVLSITWPPMFGQPPLLIQTGDWLDDAGTIYPDSLVTSHYVRLSDLGSLL